MEARGKPIESKRKVRFPKCEVGGFVQGDEGPVCGVAQVVGCHGVTVVVGHQEKRQEEEVEKQGEVEGEGEKLKDHYTWMECGWN